MDMDTNSKDRKSLPEYFQQIWTHALLTVNGVEEEATKLVGKLQGLSVLGPDEMRRQVRDFSERLLLQRKDFERQVDEAVRQRLQKVRIPRREDIVQITSRLDSLAQRIEALTR
jgi:polyhydroxyalkanoate synthesis regulator phasin